MTLLGLELNASRARAVNGALGDFPCPLPLEPPHVELAMLLSLERSTPAVGQAGLRLIRQTPHLCYRDFLAGLGAPSAPERSWLGRPKTLDVAEALTHVFRRLQPITQSSAGVVLALPGYFNSTQAALLRTLATQSRVPIMGSLPIPLATALSAYAEQSWHGMAVILDVDDHALTLSTVEAVEGQAHLLETRPYPILGLKLWKERLLDALSDGCVWQSRRDPRASPLAEQALYEQLDGVMDACRQGRLLQIALPAANWFQNLIVSPDQPPEFCQSLVHATMQEVEHFLGRPWPEGPPGVILLTAAAGRLPGLVQALRAFLEDWKPAPFLRAAPISSEDFGEQLFHGGCSGSTTVLVLSADAPARGAHMIAAYFQRGELLVGHLERMAPLPLPQPVEAGPARLHYQGEDYFVNEPRFSLGRQAGCNLVFDGDLHQGVSPRHCEIVLDYRSFLLIDRSREGTLVNDAPVSGTTLLRAGDWIRLGPQGPLLRFLGQGPGFSPLSTTA